MISLVYTQYIDPHSNSLICRYFCISSLGNTDSLIEVRAANRL